MSHRLQPGAPAGFHPRAKEFDGAFIECLRAGDYRQVDGLRFRVAGPGGGRRGGLHARGGTSAVNWNAAGHEVLSYEGPFGVGYGVAILHQSPPANAPASVAVKAMPTEAGKILPQLARRSIEAAFRGDSEKPDISAAGILGERHGVFVTIRGPHGKLRGCVGTLTPHFANTAEETWQRRARRRVSRRAFCAGRSAANWSNCASRSACFCRWRTSPRRRNWIRGVTACVVTTGDGRRGVLLPGIKEIKTRRTTTRLRAAERRHRRVRAGAPAKVHRQEIR